QAGLAVFALCARELYAHKQKHRSAFLALSQAKQFACSRGHKKTTLSRGFLNGSPRLAFR
ncbi:hypothetical protein, partial [Candidatus Avelusimicrobium sp.]|uniref:hypothetical protein n=1 Tax=Candidatus Avelusimicrobium sp. TaxID=3048833 RepID=UPI003D7E5C96